MGIREKRKAEKEAAQGPAQQKPEDVKKKLEDKKPASEPVQPAEPGAAHPMQMLDSRLRELKEARERSKADEKEDVVGRVAEPIDEKKKEEKPEAAPVGGATQNTVVSEHKTPEQIEQIVANAPDQKLSSDVSNAISKRNYDGALQAALKIKDKELRNSRIENIADEYAKTGNYSKAKEIAAKIDDPLFRARVVKEFATEFQMKSKDPKVFIKAKKTLNEAIRIAESAPVLPEREAVIKDIEEALNEFEDKKKRTRAVRDYIAGRTKKRWALGIMGGAFSLTLGVLADLYSEEIKGTLNGKHKTGQTSDEKDKPDYATEESMLALETKLDLIEDEYNLESANRFPELKNEEIDPTVLPGQRKIEDIDADIKDVEGMLETYEDGSKKKLNKKQEELVAGITKKYVEEKLQDPEIDELEKDGLQLALEDAELMKGFEKEALQAMLEKLRAESVEAEKLKAYLSGEEVASIMKADLCPVSEIDPSRIGNGVCDKNPVKKLVGKDGEVMYVSVPYDESEVCPTDCPKGKGGAKAAEIEIRRGG